MVWLPLVLLFLERAVRASGPRCYLLGAYAGVGLAMQALAVHVQVCVFTALAVFPYLGWRACFRDAGAGGDRTRLPGRLLRGLAIGAVAAAVAAGLAAVQVLPLLDLAARSARGPGIVAQAATINSVTPFRLLTLLFPHLLSRPDGSSFGYWVSWEVTVYVGVPTLFLALVAVLVRRDRYVVFFAVLAALALLMATRALRAELGRPGGAAPPGRARPALARDGSPSCGASARRRWPGTAPIGSTAARASSSPARPSTRQRLIRWWYGAVCALLGVGAAGLLLAVRAARAWLLAEPEAARVWLERHYLAFDPSVRLTVSAEDVRRLLVAALDPRAPATLTWALGVVAGYALLVLWPLPIARRSGSPGPCLRALDRDRHRRATPGGGRAGAPGCPGRRDLPPLRRRRLSPRPPGPPRRRPARPSAGPRLHVSAGVRRPLRPRAQRPAAVRHPGSGGLQLAEQRRQPGLRLGRRDEPGTPPRRLERPLLRLAQPPQSAAVVRADVLPSATAAGQRDRHQCRGDRQPFGSRRCFPRTCASWPPCAMPGRCRRGRLWPG